jgi:hypothetical protein
MTETIGVTLRPGRRRHIRDLEWLMARVEIDPMTDCWNWTGIRNHRGYGRYHFTTDDGRVLNGSAHRLALELALGRPIQPGMNVCHHCDNPPCCHAEHLFEGTTAENQRDCRSKGRTRWRDGEEHGMAKLTAEDIPLIRAALAAGETQRSCAKRFGVSGTSISNIRAGKAWRSVP